jgi:hypothetical protein
MQYTRYTVDLCTFLKHTFHFSDKNARRDSSQPRKSIKSNCCRFKYYLGDNNFSVEFAEL